MKVPWLIIGTLAGAVLAGYGTVCFTIEADTVMCVSSWDDVRLGDGCPTKSS